MKRTSSDSNFRNLTPTPYPQWVQQQNNQTIQPNNEHYPIDPPLLTDDLYAYLVDPLSKQDFERAIRIAGVKNLSELLQLTDTYKRTLLMFAGMSGNTELIKILLSSASNPDVLASMMDVNDMTALMHALNNIESIKALLSSVYFPDALASMIDSKGWTALIQAGMTGNVESIKALLGGVNNPDALVFIKDFNGWNALMHAATRGHVGSIYALLSGVSNRDALVCMKDANGMNSLMLAISNGHYESVKVLLEGISNPENLIFMQNNKNETALILAIEKINIVEFFGTDYEMLIRQYPEPVKQENKCQAELIKTLLSYVNNKDALICKQDEDGRKMLNYALRLDNAELLKILLDSVNNPEELLTMQDLQGKNLLMDAASQGKAKSIEVILRSVKNPEAFAMMKDAEGRTALMHAISDNNTNSIEAILSNVSNADQLAFMKNKDDYNALMLAAVCGDYCSITTLLDHVKNPIELIYSSMPDGTTALMLAAKCDYLDDSEDNVITAILEKAKKMRDPYYRMSPKYKKGKNSYISLDLDFLIYMKNSMGMNAFMFAMKNGIPSAILPFLILATDKLGLFIEKNNDQKNALDFIDEELCNDLISDLESKKISMELQDIDGVISLLENHKANYS